MNRPHHRPMLRDADFFTGFPDGEDPVLRREAAERTAELLIRGARAHADREVAERLVTLAETEGIEELAQLWADAPADTVAGSLWRLYLLRSWVHADPAGAAHEFAAGAAAAQAPRVVAGVAEPPGPAGLQRMVDEVLRGICVRDYADVLAQAAAFAAVIAEGRRVESTESTEGAGGAGGDPRAARMASMSRDLEHASRLERDRSLT